MFKVYCLISEKSPKFHYFGFTQDLSVRLKTHQAGQVKSTKAFLPLDLLGFREFSTLEAAIKFEKDLKSKYRVRKKFINDLLINS